MEVLAAVDSIGTDSGLPAFPVTIQASGEARNLPPKQITDLTAEAVCAVCC
jgi:hypothetical protein